MSYDIEKIIETLIQAAILEDLGDRGDITSDAIKMSDRIVKAKIIAKQQGVLCGVKIALTVFTTIDENIQINVMKNNGEWVDSGDVILELQGSSINILKAERTALNFLGKLSGVATLTNLFVKAVEGTKTRILDTRKTTPGWRQLEKFAVSCGGGQNHRIGLYDMFLIKENHIASAGGIEAAVKACRNYLSANGFSAEIEVETQNLDEVKQAFELNVDRIMLDNMSFDEMKTCVNYIDCRIPLEASGNVNLQTVRQIAETGVDFISIGSLTHSASTFDTSLLILS
jgi:nicotinate-nucleotide pyrophosphorylase (carboxylating)